MKHLHKFASVLLALVMAFSLMAPAFASSTTTQTPETGSITITNATNGHTYWAYQIFKGDLAYEGTGTETDAKNPVLSNIEWGADVVEASIPGALSGLAWYESGMSAARVAELLAAGKKVTGEGESAQEIEVSAEAFAQAIANALVAMTTNVKKGTAAATAEGSTEYTARINDLPVGYYLVKDEAPSDAATPNDAVSLYMLQVVGPAEVVSKVGTPTPDKGVKDVNDSTGVTDETYNKTADHDIGDIMDYQLKATLPANFTNFDKYELVFTDTMGKGLTLVNNTSTKDNYTAVTAADNQDAATNLDVASILTVKVGETTISSGFTAKYYKDGENTVLVVTFADVMAEAVGATNNSVITIDYKARLNESAVFKNENTLVLTYPRNPNQNQNGEQTPGETPPVTVVVFTFTTTVNKVDPEKNPLAGAAFKLEKWIATPTAEDANAGSWVEVKAFTVDEDDPATSFSFNGLDDGWYKLTETVTPAGYNTIAPVYFKIEATHNGDGSSKDAATATLTVTQVKENGEAMDTGDTITLKFTKNDTEGTATTDVVNQSGATLPETGGIGTTIFYVVGGLLTVGAVVLLVTKKRMSADSDK